MTLPTATPVPTQDSDKQDQNHRSERIEQLTVSYMRGEIDLMTYRQKLREINARLDLRKLASKIRKSKSGK